MPMHYLADQAAEPQLPTLTCQETRIQITQRTRRWNRKPVVTVVDAVVGRVVDSVTTGRVLIDGTGSGEVDGEMIRDRRQLAADGLVVPVVVMHRQTRARHGVRARRGYVQAGREQGAERFSRHGSMGFHWKDKLYSRA